MAAAMVLDLPLYRTFQVYKFGNCKYNFLLNYFGVLFDMGLCFAKYR